MSAIRQIIKESTRRKENLRDFTAMNGVNETDDTKLEQQRRVNFNDEPESREFFSGDLVGEDKRASDKSNKIPVIQRKGATIAERQVDLQNAIVWLRRELQEMQLQDKNLARQMIDLRKRIKNMMKVDGDDMNDLETTESFDSFSTM